MSCRLTVLMAVRNGGPYLQTAIDSILGQTYRDFHFLIVDDASTDGTPEAIRAYDDDRIQLVCLDKNVGQTAALNVGLRQATTPWIARMDADDYSAPTRFEEQMEALDADPSLSCLGTFAWTFRDDPQLVEGVISTHTGHADIMRALLRGSPLIHGTIVVGREALLEVGAYDSRYRYSADVEMYDRLLNKHRAGAIPRQLLGVRRHSEQGSRTRVAFDENIQIFSRRLATDNYSPEEATIVRAHLSRYHVVRAHHFAGRANVWGFLKDLGRAFQLSPSKYLQSCFRVFIVGMITERNRARLRQLLSRRSPRSNSQ